MTDLTELKRLHAAATGSEIVEFIHDSTAIWFSAIHNAFPQLAATIEQQEKEIERLRKGLIEARSELNTRITQCTAGPVAGKLKLKAAEEVYETEKSR